MTNEIEKQLQAAKEVIQAAEDFLSSLPEGWLAHTSGDVGALNDFYINLRKFKNLSIKPEVQNGN